jgi:adenosylcobinamide-GDP ribazoletransferase
MPTPLNAFLTAVMLLTRIPVARWVRFSPEAASASIVFFPAVGALVGVCSAGVLSLATHLNINGLPALLSALLTSILITGALHEDGLADAADGLFGGHTAEQRMAIMKDSRMGTFGGIALWFSLTARFLLLFEIALHGTHWSTHALIWGHTLSRCSAVGLLQLLPHVGPDASRARDFCKKLNPLQLAIALLPPLLLFLFYYPTAARLALPGLLLLVVLASAYLRSKLGGLTGDCVGAVTQLAEIVTLACFTALI